MTPYESGSAGARYTQTALLFFDPSNRDSILAEAFHQSKNAGEKANGASTFRLAETASVHSARSLPILGALPGDLPGYWMRFILSFSLLGIVPALAALLFRERPAALGLSLKVPLLKKPWFWLLVPLAAGIGALGALSPDLAAYYPYSRDLIQRVRETGFSSFFLHFAAYAIL
jgi:hypothetical protein